MAFQVFVSHTQRDEQFCDIFDRACARVGLRAFRSEFERIELPAWQTIRDAIRKSRALFLLIGPELTRAQALPDPFWAHTQNWIAYEIGVACERGMDVWVICDDVRINFPVPYLNNYLPASPRHRDIFDALVEDLKVYAQGRKFRFPDPIYGTRCPYDNCEAVFNLPTPLSLGEIIVCPQCLQEIPFPYGFPIEA